MGMKQILLMMAAVVFVGCGEKAKPLPAPHTPEDKTKTAQAAESESQETVELEPFTDPITEKDVVGTYQMNLPNGLFTMTLLKDGKSILVHATNSGEKKPETGKWKIEDANLFLIGNDETGVMKINSDRSLSPIAEIKNGLREDWDPKITSVVSFKKIK
jgi:hypothetical protein